MPAEKRSHDDMEHASKQPAAGSPSSKPASDPITASATAGMLGLPFMLPSAALMAMSSVQQADQAAGAGGDDAAAALQQQTAAALAIAGAAAAAQAAADNGEAKAPGSELSAQQQQQLVQQQLQLLQMQQQHLQQMSPGDLSAVATMAHQMALGMVMMPMMPLMMMNQNGNGNGSPQAEGGQGSPDRELGNSADGLGMGDATAMPLMATAAAASAGGFAMGNDDTPKRKRGRPPKKDMLSRTKPEGMEKALKQFPLWGYGMPLPFLPGFLPPGAAVGGGDQALAQDESAGKDGEDDASRMGKVGASKKKTRGTGKPRGRPRTRPRPGEVIRRVKPPPIAPANFPGMQEYLTQKMAEWKATQAGNAADDNRVVTAFGATLLPGDHE